MKGNLFEVLSVNLYQEHSVKLNNFKNINIVWIRIQ